MKNKLDTLRKKRVIATFAKNSKYWKHSKPIERPYQTMDFTCKKCGYMIPNAFVQSFLGKRVMCPSCVKHNQIVAKEKDTRSDVKKQPTPEIFTNKAPFILDTNKVNQLLKLDMTNVKWSSAPKNGNSHGEAWVKLFLDMLGLQYKQQVTFSTLKSPKGWKLRYDFLVENSIIIEYDGVQHRHYQSHLFSNQADFNYRKKCDLIKNSFAKANNIPLIRLKQEKPSSLKNKLVKCLLYYTKDC